jgi:hypothetical protein
MIKFLVPLVLCFYPSFAFSQSMPYVPSCIEQDYVVIKDDGIDRAVVIYSNSIENCSNNFEAILTSPNGISVHVKITIGDTSTDQKEIIEVTPLDLQMMSFPPSGFIQDGEIGKFIIAGGLS